VNKSNKNPTTLTESSSNCLPISRMYVESHPKRVTILTTYNGNLKELSFIGN